MKPNRYSSADFVKNHDEDYFQLLRLARKTNHEEGGEVCDGSLDIKAIVRLLNNLPLYINEHKRIIPLLNDTANKLSVFKDLSIESQTLLTAFTQQGVVTELAKNMQLNSIISVLSQDNIPLILLKGAAFSGVLYHAEAPRTSNDLDILIHKKNWDKAVHSIKKIMSYTEKPQPDIFGDLYELTFNPKSNVGASLDLHVSLINPFLFKIDEDELWKESLEHPSFDNELVRMLSPEHALIHQALHAYKDMDFSKYNLVDSHEIIMLQRPSMGKVIETAKEWGVSTPLFVLLQNCLLIMGADINNYVDNKLLKQIKPNNFTYKMIDKLLKSKFTQPIGNKKPFRYRINQLASQFAFSGNVIRPLKLQCLYLKLVMIKFLKD